jgi:hypothetical protein
MLEDFPCQDSDLVHNARMTTVAELIAHLQTLPQDLVVQCLQESFYGYSSKIDWKDLVLENDLYVIGGYLEIGDK